MMKNRFLFVAMLFAALSMGFVSCDNKGNEPDDPQGEQTEQNGSTENNGGEETPEPADSYNGHAYVDLGLSVKWATCNVGATKPEEYGNYYAWGEVEPKEVYSWSTYFDTTEGGTTFLKYNNESGKTTLDKEDDAVAVNMGGSWRMPTIEEQKELIDECNWTWTTLNDVNGYNVEGPNGNSIFLPATGFRVGSDLNNAGSNGGYWSSSLDTDNLSAAYGFGFGSDLVTWGGSTRYLGIPVRGVIK